MPGLDLAQILRLAILLLAELLKLRQLIAELLKLVQP